MFSWQHPHVPSAVGTPIPLKLYDTSTQKIEPIKAGETAGLYVCGITPYDATHLGHAATYVVFDLIHRILVDNGHYVHFVENVTDVDDPLFERAQRDGIDWRELGQDQINLFRSDMVALNIIPPRDYIGIEESINEVIDFVQKLIDSGATYTLENGDIYARITATPQFGYISHYDEKTMLKLFEERGGDPQTPGKENPLDALIWRAHREGEPSWDAPFGKGRPGWHVECSTIATNRLQDYFTIQGGGCDLIFPHHEFSAAHYEAVTGKHPMAKHYVHTGMIALNGTKMSKSLGNLVFVSKLRLAGHEADAIRLGIYEGHYRNDRDWSDEVLQRAEERLSQWRKAAAVETQKDNDGAGYEAIQAVREALSNDLDTPAALNALDQWAKTGGNGREVAQAVWALLGLNIFTDIIHSYIDSLRYFALGLYLKEEDRKRWEPLCDVKAYDKLDEILQLIPYSNVDSILYNLGNLNEENEWALIEREEEKEIQELLTLIYGEVDEDLFGTDHIPEL